MDISGATASERSESAVPNGIIAARSRLPSVAGRGNLRVLEDAGLVRGVRHGRESHFELNATALQEAQQALQTMSRQWDDALARLKSFVEE